MLENVLNGQALSTAEDVRKWSNNIMQERKLISNISGTIYGIIQAYYQSTVTVYLREAPILKNYFVTG